MGPFVPRKAGLFARPVVGQTIRPTVDLIVLLVARPIAELVISPTAEWQETRPLA